MRLRPRYDGPVVLEIDDQPSSQLAPVVRQRRRFQQMLAELDLDAWGHPSRCKGWTVRDVTAHLVTVNDFWNASLVAGLSGSPTRVLGAFDPAATPALMVDAMRSLTPQEILERFLSSNEMLLTNLSTLSSAQWAMLAESPAGHVPIRLMAQHALWDSWIHERDIALPLAIRPVLEADEVTSCLRYAAALSPVLGRAVGHTSEVVSVAVASADPAMEFVVEVGECVVLRSTELDSRLPCLRGDAVELVEALSLRAPLGAETPLEWRVLLGGLQAAFGGG